RRPGYSGTGRGGSTDPHRPATPGPNEGDAGSRSRTGNQRRDPGTHAAARRTGRRTDTARRNARLPGQTRRALRDPVTAGTPAQRGDRPGPLRGAGPLRSPGSPCPARPRRPVFPFVQEVPRWLSRVPQDGSPASPWSACWPTTSAPSPTTKPKAPTAPTARPPVPRPRSPGVGSAAASSPRPRPSKESPTRGAGAAPAAEAAESAAPPAATTAARRPGSTAPDSSNSTSSRDTPDGSPSP